MTTKRCIILVGLPASGKSTWIKEHYADAEVPHVVLSTDNILEEIARDAALTYDEAFQKYSKAVEHLMWHDCERVIDEQWETIIVDRTNMSVKARRKFIERLKPAGYEFSAVIFEKPDPVEWKRRLEGRLGKTIPKFVLDSMEKSYEKPSFSEGFDQILEE